VVILLPVSDGVLEPEAAIALREAQAFKIHQAFGGFPFAADFAEQIVEERRLLERLIKELFSRMRLAGQLAEKVPDFGRETGRVGAEGFFPGFGFRFVEVDAALWAAGQFHVKNGATASAFDFVFTGERVEAGGH
jgi:hypothetical protein